MSNEDSHMDRRWRPLLTGKAAEEAWRAIDDIVEALVRVEAESDSPDDKSFAHEIALLLAYVARVRDDDSLAQQADAIVERITSSSQPPMRLGLFGGLAGLAWTLGHVNRLLEYEDDEEDDETDLFLMEHLDHARPHGPYDLIDGTVGLGIYFLDRLPRRSATTALRHAFERLAADAEHQGSAVTWHTAAELLPPWQREDAPTGYYNAGVAHGVPGIVYLLSELVLRRIGDADTEALLRGAVEWVLGLRHGPHVASWIATGKPTRPHGQRLAWCYGELGVAAVLHHAGAAIGEPRWEATALDWLRACAARLPQKSGVRDAGLCHGAAGNAHIFNRFYQRTGDSALGDAARRWFEVALRFRVPGKGHGGFSAYAVNPVTRTGAHESSPGFLEGSAGIALALLAAVSHVEPAWDRRLALS